jgi:hypothetical protein
MLDSGHGGSPGLEPRGPIWFLYFDPACFFGRESLSLTIRGRTTNIEEEPSRHSFDQHNLRWRSQDKAENQVTTRLLTYREP